MDTTKLSSKYYKPGIRQEPCIASKIMRVSLIILILSWFLAMAFAMLLEMGFKSWIFVTTMIFIVVFAMSIVFSFIMLFISKKHSKNIWLRMICYLILIGIFVTVLIGSFSVTGDVLESIFNSNGLVDENQIYEILKSFGAYYTVLIILEVAFNFSMLVSFKIKKLTDNSSAKASVIVYVLISVAQILIYAFQLITPSWFSLITSVLWVVCLYFALETRTVDVACVVLIDEKGEEIVDKEQEQIDIKNKRANVSETLKKFKLAFLIIVGIIGFVSIFNIIELGKQDNLFFAMASFVIIFFSVLVFCFWDNTEHLWLDMLSCLTISLSLILILLLFMMKPYGNDITAYILCAIVILSLTFGMIIYFFFYDASKEISLKLRIPVFAVFSVGIIFSILSIFVVGGLDQYKHMFPPLLWISVIAIALMCALKNNNRK